MEPLEIENIRLDPQIGDGILFTVSLSGISHRFFISRDTLKEVTRTQLGTNQDMFAAFERNNERVIQAVTNTLRFGSSPNVTFLKTAFFN